MKNLEEIALEIRQTIYSTVCENRAGHLASSLSSVEIMVAIYFGGILHYKSNQPEWEARDRFILSKGHSALCLYAVLAEAGYYHKKEIESFCKLGTRYGGLPLKGKVPGVEATTGSLGHGLSFAAGIALYSKILHKEFNVFTLVGDGELQEGEIWEAFMFISQYKLNNLVTIIDNNRIQATGYTKNIIKMEPLKNKLIPFGFEVEEVDGHDISKLIKVLQKHGKKPRIIIADTVKGKGISYIENQADWHYKMPNENQVLRGKADLQLLEEEI